MTLRDSDGQLISQIPRTPLQQGTHPLLSRWEIVKYMLRFGIPTTLSYTGSFGLILIDVLGGHIPGNTQDNTAATTLATSFYNTLAMLSLAPLFSMGIFASRELGKLKQLRDESASEEEIRACVQTISNIVGNGLILSGGILALPMGMMCFSDSLLTEVFGQALDIAELAKSFLFPCAMAMPGALARIDFEQLMLACNLQIKTMAISLSSFGIGVFLSVMFSLGYFGLPALGFPGIAYGIIAEAYLTSAGFALYLALSKTFKEFNFFRNFHCNRKRWQEIVQLLKIGLPITLTVAAEVAGSFVMSMLAGILGKDSLAALYFSSQLSFLTLIPSLAFAQILAQRISGLIGQRDYSNASRTAMIGTLVPVACLTPLCAAAAAYPRMLTYVLADPAGVTPAVLEIADKLVPTMAGAALVNASRLSLAQAPRGAGKNIVPMGITVVNTILEIALGALLAFVGELGVNGLGIGSLLGLAMSVIFLLIYNLKTMTPAALEKAHNSPETTSPSFWRRCCRKGTEDEEEPLPINAQPSNSP